MSGIQALRRLPLIARSNLELIMPPRSITLAVPHRSFIPMASFKCLRQRSKTLQRNFSSQTRPLRFPDFELASLRSTAVREFQRYEVLHGGERFIKSLGFNPHALKFFHHENTSDPFPTLEKIKTSIRNPSTAPYAIEAIELLRHHYQIMLQRRPSWSQERLALWPAELYGQFLHLVYFFCALKRGAHLLDEKKLQRCLVNVLEALREKLTEDVSELSGIEWEVQNLFKFLRAEHHPPGTKHHTCWFSVNHYSNIRTGKKQETITMRLFGLALEHRGLLEHWETLEHLLLANSDEWILPAYPRYHDVGIFGLYGKELAKDQSERDALDAASIYMAAPWPLPASAMERAAEIVKEIPIFPDEDELKAIPSEKN